MQLIEWNEGGCLARNSMDECGNLRGVSFILTPRLVIAKASESVASCYAEILHPQDSAVTEHFKYFFGIGFAAIRKVVAGGKLRDSGAGGRISYPIPRIPFLQRQIQNLIG